jgi:hypothetical protein
MSSIAKQKRVHFCPHVVAYIDQGGSRDMRRLWYSPLDLARFRRNARRASQHIFISDAESDEEYTYTRIMELVMDACLKASDADKVGCTDDSSILLAPSLQDRLERCVHHEPELYGLHKYCVKKLLDHKAKSRSDIVAVVREKTYLESSNHIIEDLRRATRPSSLFARVIAQAAAKAA